jgi:hypothetical protein
MIRASKYNWEEIDKVIVENPHLKNGEIGKMFGAALSTISWRRSQLGLRKMELHKWNDKEIEWLKKLYKVMGDLEIALIFDEAFPKEKSWTLKHIEKKRNYLGLHRTKEELRQIKRRNAMFGHWAVHQRITQQTDTLTTNILTLYFTGKTKYHQLKEEVQKRPELLELKRTQILLNRTIKQHEKHKSSKRQLV